MIHYLLFVILVLQFQVEPNPDLAMNELSASFCEEYRNLNVSPLLLSYDSNLENIQGLAAVEKQGEFFVEYSERLKKIDKENLSNSMKIDCALMTYEIELNLERIELEKKWHHLRIDSIPGDGLANVPMGNEWYAYYLKKWIGADVSPAEIFDLGLKEIERVNGNITQIQSDLGMSDDDFYNQLNELIFLETDAEVVRDGYEVAQDIVLKSYANSFPFQNLVERVKIDKSENRRFENVPAYYSNQTFFFVLFEKPFNNRQTDIFFLHEGIPGHHYQRTIENSLDLSEIRRLNAYYGYTEGWAAYVEELGKDLGLYRSEYDYLGKWEWDIVRSVRVSLDVGLNYFGWSDEAALAFWKTYIPNQDDIAMREINRMRNWPAQVVTYKYGANKILEWKEMAKAQLGYSEKEFHKKILINGALPFVVLEDIFLIN